MSQASVGISRRWSIRMRSKEASDYLREIYGIQLSQSTLNKLRCIGGGPPFQYDGRFPVYQPLGLDSFAVARLGPERISTSDTGLHMAA